MESKGTRATAIVGKNSLDFVEAQFALYAARQPLVVVQSEEKAGALAGLGIDRCIVPEISSGWFEAKHPLIHDETLAQISYTSGTEGRPKGILLTHSNLADAAERIIEKMRMTADIREYVGVPANFSFGMGRYRAIAAVGGKAYLPKRGFDPLEFARMLDAGEVNSISVVPSLLRILLKTPELFETSGKKLRWMKIGSQHLTVGEKQHVQDLFPDACIVQHYGLTEASRSTFLTISETSPDYLDSVGQPTGQTEIELSADNRIRIRGPHVAKLHIDAFGVHDLLDEDGWLQTNDVGHMRDGYLFFDGRADDLINLGGVKIVPDQLEDSIHLRLQSHTKVAVTKVPDPLRGDGVLVAIEGKPSQIERVKEVAIDALAEIGVVAGNALHVTAMDALPVTDTGKIKRAELTKSFVERAPTSPGKIAEPKRNVDDVLSFFQKEFPGHTIRPDDTFVSLGGDSLHFIQFSLGFEQRFGQMPENWEKLTVAEFQRHLSTSPKSNGRLLETATLARGFFMICIIALHTGAFEYSSNFGAAYFLYLLAGYSVARFQLPEIIRTGSIKTLMGTVKYVAIPTFLMVAALQILTQRFELFPLLLVSNYLDPANLSGFTFYFAEIYIQLLLFAAVLFSVPKVRAAFSQHPFLSAVVLLFAVTGIKLVVETIWDADYNYHRTPWNYGWVFTLGILMAVATDARTQAAALIAVIAASYIQWGATSASFYVIGGSIAVLYIRALVVPASVKRVIAEVASASLFMYLSHYQMIVVVEKLFGEKRPWIAFIASILVGIVLAHAYDWLERSVRRYFLQSRRAKT